MDTHWLRKMKKEQLIALILEMNDERGRLRKVLDGLQEDDCSTCEGCYNCTGEVSQEW